MRIPSKLRNAMALSAAALALATPAKGVVITDKQQQN
jgi:hypothetical protein